MSTDELAPPFIDLFGGLHDSAQIGAYGTGRGQWVKRPLTHQDVVDHLEGRGPGIGIPPLRPDNTVMFAAIDLDEPDFAAAREMQRFLPGTSWIERSRSGNAHVWVFFSEPCPAWLPMAILKEAIEASGKTHVEVFPKQHDFARVKLGNYINLPYHGSERPILHNGEEPISLKAFLREALSAKNDPEDWEKRARWLLLEPPGAPKPGRQEWGQRDAVHECFHYIVDRALDGDAPILEGHRSVVFFNLAKMLVNVKYYDDIGPAVLYEVNACSPDPLPKAELDRIIRNAERGQFTSTGCDDPVMAPYIDPNCPIARRR